MAQVSYGTITITDTNDIESITVEYNRNQSSSDAPSATDSGWSTTRPDWAQGYYIWQRTRIHKSGTTANTDVIGTAVCITGSTGSTGAPGRGLTDTTTQYCNYGTGEPADDYSGWVDAPPNYDSSKPNYWVMITNTYSAAPTSEIIKYKDEALTKAVADAATANSIATHSNENAQGAMSQAASNVNEVKRIWYAQAAATPVPNAPSTGVTTSAAHDAWSITKPTADESYQYYFYCDQTKTGGGVYSWSEVILDTSTLSQYQIGAMSAKVRNYWWDSAGAHIASGTSTSGEISATSPISSYGYNTLTSLTGISFRYNDAKVVDLNSTTPSLDFYQPPTISGNTVTQGKKTMMLSANALSFYDPTNGTTEQAKLDTNGLVLNKGGIKAGTAGQSGFIYLSTENYGSNLTINSHQASNWREIIGTKFGVDANGNLYASNAEISGKITVGSGSTIDSGATISGTSASTVVSNANAGKTANDALPNKASINAEYSVEIEVKDIDYITNKLNLVAHIYKLGVEQTTTDQLNGITYAWKKIKNGVIMDLSYITKEISIASGADLEATYVCVISKA